MRERTGRWRGIAAWAAVAALLAACSSGRDDDAVPPTTVLTRPTTAPVATAPAPDDTGTLLAPAPAETLPGEDSAVPDDSLGPQPTGVPGLDSDVPFCSAYVRATATLRALLVAISFGDGDAVGAARYEVVAAPAVVRSVASALGALPDELETERTLLADRVLGPLLRRAERAVAELGEAGASGDDLTALEEAWEGVLGALDDETGTVPAPALPPDLAGLVDDAAAAFADLFVPLPADPSLVRDDVSTPLTDAYVARECPEARGVVVGDSI